MGSNGEYFPFNIVCVCAFSDAPTEAGESGVALYAAYEWSVWHNFLIANFYNVFADVRVVQMITRLILVCCLCARSIFRQQGKIDTQKF